MMRLFRQHASLFLLVSCAFLLTNCQGMQLTPFKAGVTLPYSEDCFFKNVVTDEEVRYAKPECEQIKKRSLIITSEDWKILRKDIQSNCQVQKCTQLVGQFDQLFLIIDQSLNQLP